MKSFKVKRKYSAVEGSFSYLGGILAVIIISLIVQAVYTQVGNVPDVPAFFLGSLTQVGLLIAAIVPPVALGSRPTYSLKRISVKTGFVSALLCVLCLVGFMGIGTMFNMLLYVNGYVGGVYVDSSTPLQMVLSIIRVVIFAPIVEELLFRRSVLSSLGLFGKMSDRKRVIFMVIGSGLLFSLFHMNPMQTVYQFFLGCVLGYAVISFGSIIPGIIIHALNNAIALVLSATGMSGILDQLIYSCYTDPRGIIICLLASLGLAVGLGVVIKLVCDKFGGQKPLSNYLPGESKKESKPEIAQNESGVQVEPVANFVNYADKGGTMAATIMYTVGLIACVALWISSCVMGFAA